MGMIGNLLRVSNIELEAYLNDSSLLEDRIYSETNAEDPNYIDIDKSWDGIYYLLTGYPTSEMEDAVPPLSWTLFNLQIIDREQNLGYGPAYYSTSEQVKEINEALNTISSSDLRQKYDAKKMIKLDIYPEIWDEGEDAISYLIYNFEAIKTFYNKASERDQAVITFIN